MGCLWSLMKNFWTGWCSVGCANWTSAEPNLSGRHWFEAGLECKYCLPKMDTNSSRANKSDFSSANGVWMATLSHMIVLKGEQMMLDKIRILILDPETIVYTLGVKLLLECSVSIQTIESSLQFLIPV